MPVSATVMAMSWPLLPHLDGDRARLGEFGGVAQEIDQDLAQLVLVAEQGRQSRLDLLDQLYAPAPDHRLDGAQALIDQRLERELERPHLHAAGLDLGQVEHVVDQPEQMVGAGQDLLEIAVLALGQEILAAAHDQPGEADDRVHRRPQLVAHVGQELGLRAARLLGLLLGRLQRLLGALEVGQVVVGQHPPAVGQRHAAVLEHAAVGEAPLGGERAGLAHLVEPLADVVAPTPRRARRRRRGAGCARARPENRSAPRGSRPACRTARERRGCACARADRARASARRSRSSRAARAAHAGSSPGPRPRCRGTR